MMPTDETAQVLHDVPFSHSEASLTTHPGQWAAGPPGTSRSEHRGRAGGRATQAATHFRRARIDDPAQHEQFLRDLDTVDKLRGVVPDGESMAQFALRFVRSHPAVSTVIPGAKYRRQAETNAAAGLRPLLSEQEKAAVDRLVPPGGGRKIWPA